MKLPLLLLTLLIIRQVELNRHRHHHHKEQEEILNTIGPKQGTYKNKLVAEYGTNFRYLGMVKNGLDRVTVVTSIPIPRYEKLQVHPLDFGKCAELLKDIKSTNAGRTKRTAVNSLLSGVASESKVRLAAWQVVCKGYALYRVSATRKVLHRKGTRLVVQ